MKKAKKLTKKITKKIKKEMKKEMKKGKREKGEKKKNGDKKIENLRKELRKIIDPEVGINIIDMGLVKDIRKTEKDKVEIVFSPTIPTCPIISFFVNEIRKKAEKLGLDCEVKVE